MSGQSNYNGSQPNNSAYIKYFVQGAPMNLWKIITYPNTDGTSMSIITPTSTTYKNLYIPGDLFIDGNIIKPSDIKLKKNVKLLEQEITEKIMNLKPSSFEFKNDRTNHVHYGFIAEELETEYPELIYGKPDAVHTNIKSVNYLEIIPLLVHKLQLMQKEIDVLKNRLNSSNSL